MKARGEPTPSIFRLRAMSDALGRCRHRTHLVVSLQTEHLAFEINSDRATLAGYEKNTLLQKYNETLRDEKSTALAKLKLTSEEVDAKKNEAANWRERWAKDEKVKEVLKEQLTQNTNQLEKLRSELECKVTALREKEIKMVEDNNMLSNELEHLNKTLLKKQRIEEELNEKVRDLQQKLKDMGEREAMLLQYPDLNGNLLTPTCKGDPMEDMKGQLKANKLIAKKHCTASYGNAKSL
uniref:Uncharacterized protein n=1 Tax=Timema tahoe TaxID=61484 RepID=A0A7R9IA89_9NEOP|nr:unnamed protein product [Timema tahoe]